jgi:hypothetical protein
MLRTQQTRSVAGYDKQFALIVNVYVSISTSIVDLHYSPDLLIIYHIHCDRRICEELNFLVLTVKAMG